jgi:DNA end-binding protein Ku
MATRPRRKKPADETQESTTHDIWKGSITFGLVEIPVALVSTDKSTRLSLSYLDRRDFSPVGYRRYNKRTEAEVPWSEIVHGYEYAKNEYVALSKAELQRANPELTRTIAIEQFVDAAEIDPMLFEKAYYVEPLKKGSKSYGLLRDTLERTGKLGIARVVVRTRERLGALGVRGPALVLYVLRFTDEVRTPDELDNLKSARAPAHATPQELKMAERLVEDMSGKFRPDQYHDEYTKDLERLIQKKLSAGDVHALVEEEEEEPEPRQRGEIIDLMPLLQRSLGARRKGPPERSSKRSSSRSRGREGARPRSRGSARARRSA